MKKGIEVGQGSEQINSERRNFLGGLAATTAAVSLGAMGTLSPNTAEAGNVRKAFNSMEDAYGYASESNQRVVRDVHGNFALVSQGIAASLISLENTQQDRKGLIKLYKGFEGYRFKSGFSRVTIDVRGGEAPDAAPVGDDEGTDVI